MKRASLYLSFLLLSAAVTTAHAQMIAPLGVPVNSIDYKRLARIDTLVEGYIAKGWVNGVVTIIVKDGAVIQNKGYGYADLEAKRAMKKDDLFRIASQTKALTSTAIMLLYEQGKLTLDEPVSDFIPSFKHPQLLDTYNAADTTYTAKPAKREITIRDLLTHTSGLDYAGIGSEKMKAIYAKAGIVAGLGVFDADLKERMSALGKLPLANQPGDKWVYSLGIDVLGAVVEIISGESLEAYLTTYIFQPLGMKDTYFNVPAGKAGRLTAVYTEDSTKKVIRWTKERTGVDPDYPLASKHYFAGGAGLTSTAYDYAIFLQMMLNGGRYNGVQLLSPRTVELMTSGQLPAGVFGDDNFGLGFGITSARTGAKQPRHEGSFSWGGFFGTTYWADPKAHTICLIMTQQTPNSHGDLPMKFEQLVYQSFK